MSGSHSRGAGVSSNKMWFPTVITFTFYKSDSLALIADTGLAPSALHKLLQLISEDTRKMALKYMKQFNFHRALLC